MADYVLCCGSTADLSKEHFERIGVPYIPYNYTLDGVEYKDDLGESMPFDEFYDKLSAGAEVHTSQINIADYTDFFCSFLEQGKDVLYIELSSGITGAFNTSSNAAQAAMEQYPGRTVLVVDSLSASAGYGLFVDALASKRDEGLSLTELRDWAEENKLRVHDWFLSADLSFYIRGGRISKTAGTVASALGICPLLHMDTAGHLVPVDKLHNKKRTLKNIVAKMEELAEGGTDYSGKCFLSYSGNSDEDAVKVATLVEETFPKLNGRVAISHIGTTVGSHSGPGTVALFFFGTPRKD